MCTTRTARPVAPCPDPQRHADGRPGTRGETATRRPVAAPERAAEMVAVGRRRRQRGKRGQGGDCSLSARLGRVVVGLEDLGHDRLYEQCPPSNRCRTPLPSVEPLRSLGGTVNHPTARSAVLLSHVLLPPLFRCALRGRTWERYRAGRRVWSPVGRRSPGGASHLRRERVRFRARVGHGPVFTSASGGHRCASTRRCARRGRSVFSGLERRVAFRTPLGTGRTRYNRDRSTGL